MDNLERAVRGVIFDLWGTLIHRAWASHVPPPEMEREFGAALSTFARAELGCRHPEALAEAVLKALRASTEVSGDELERTTLEMIKEAFRLEGLPTDDAILKRADAAFVRPDLENSRLYPAAHDALSALKGLGFRLALVSNSPCHQLVVDIAARVGISPYFDPLVTSAGFGQRKPHPAIFMNVAEQWRVPPEEIIVVGDTVATDVLGAVRAGMRSVLVNVEPRPENVGLGRLAQPWAEITDLGQLGSLLDRGSA
jgi:HAD superfamily phosphatase (TIGR01668 family)